MSGAFLAQHIGITIQRRNVGSFGTHPHGQDFGDLWYADSQQPETHRLFNA